MKTINLNELFGADSNRELVENKFMEIVILVETFIFNFHKL